MQHQQQQQQQHHHHHIQQMPPQQQQAPAIMSEQPIETFNNECNVNNQSINQMSPNIMTVPNHHPQQPPQHTQQQQHQHQHQQEQQHHYHHHKPQPQPNHQPQIFDNINNNNNNNENSVMKNDNNVNLVVSSEQIVSNDDQKLVKMTQEKLAINKNNSVKQSAWVTGPPLQHQHHQPLNKKTTATVSVSAIPNKELIGQPPGIKQQKNVSPVPFTSNKSHLAPQKSLPLANEEQQMAPPPVAMESKKVEAIPQREAVHNEVTVKPIEFVPAAKEPPQVVQPAPPVIVPTPTTTAPVAQPPTKSWASLFNQTPAATHISHTPAPAPVINNSNNNVNSSTISANNSNNNSNTVANVSKVNEPMAVAKKPVAKVSPFESQASNTTSVSTSTTAAIKKPLAEAKSQQAADDFSLKLCGEYKEKKSILCLQMIDMKIY